MNTQHARGFIQLKLAYILKTGDFEAQCQQFWVDRYVVDYCSCSLKKKSRRFTVDVKEYTNTMIFVELNDLRN